jgi:hypothetical protein
LRDAAGEVLRLQGFVCRLLTSAALQPTAKCTACCRPTAASRACPAAGCRCAHCHVASRSFTRDVPCCSSQPFLAVRPHRPALRQRPRTRRSQKLPQQNNSARPQ